MTKCLEILNFVLHEVLTFHLHNNFICSKRQTPHVTQGEDAATAEEFPRGEVAQDEDDQRPVHGEPGVLVRRVGQQLGGKQLDQRAEQQERRTGEL